MAERIKGTAGETKKSRTLLQRTAEEYEKALDIEDEEERREQFYRLAERFFFAPENVAMRRSHFRHWDYEGTERDLMTQRGDRGDKGPLYSALDNIIQWFPKLLESGGTLPFRWRLLVTDWLKHWHELTHGTESHPKFSMDASDSDDGDDGRSLPQFASSDRSFEFDQEVAAFETRTGISRDDLLAVGERVSSGFGRKSALAMRRILLSSPDEPTTEEGAEPSSHRIARSLIDGAEVFWRRRLLLTTAFQSGQLAPGEVTKSPRSTSF